MIDMYDDDGELIRDAVRREKYLLSEESDRIKAFLADVARTLDIDAEGEGAFASAVQRLERICREDPDSDAASDARRFLNRAAAIDWSIRLHDCFFRKRNLSIDLNLYIPSL